MAQLVATASTHRVTPPVQFLSFLTRDELMSAADRLPLTVRDRRRKDAYIAAVLEAGAARDVVGALPDARVRALDQPVGVAAASRSGSGYF